MSAFLGKAKNMTKSGAVLPRVCGAGFFNVSGVENVSEINDCF
jgi:hypothetical protein